MSEWCDSQKQSSSREKFDRTDVWLLLGDFEDLETLLSRLKS